MFHPNNVLLEDEQPKMQCLYPVVVFERRFDAQDMCHLDTEWFNMTMTPRELEALEMARQSL